MNRIAATICFMSLFGIIALLFARLDPEAWSVFVSLYTVVAVPALLFTFADL